jgi:hypothetical protein
MKNIKTFDQVNEELFGIGRSNKNYKLVDSITSAIFDNKDKISLNGDILSFDMDIDGEYVEIKSPMAIINSKDLSVEVDGANVDLSHTEKNRIQTQLRNYSRFIKSNKHVERETSLVENSAVKYFSEFK